MKKLTIEEIKKIAMQHYNTGGYAIIECWEDKQIQNWIDGTQFGDDDEEPGTIEELLKMFDEPESY